MGQVGVQSGGALRDHGHTASGDGSQLNPDSSLSQQPVQGFGDGRDGDVVIAINTTLARDMNYNNLTVNVGVILYPAGYLINVRGTLLNNGTIDSDGGVGGNPVAGVGGVKGEAPYDYTTPRAYHAIPGDGGAGGAGGGVGVAVAAGGVGGTKAIAGTERSPVVMDSGAGGGGGAGYGLAPVVGSAGGAITEGSAGGGGGTSVNVAVPADLGGGGGGGGGGSIVIFAFVINNAGTIRARGGAGGNGQTSGPGGGSGNGGGGGGGSIVIFYRTATALGTRQVTGGLAGVGGLGGVNGTAGHSIAVQM